jgi:hypothetical protein
MNGPDTRYMMMWGGEWRPVTNMFTADGNLTDSVLRAAKAVLFVEDGDWVATLVSPGDLIARQDRDPEAREWTEMPVNDT